MAFLRSERALICNPRASVHRHAPSSGQYQPGSCVPTLTFSIGLAACCCGCGAAWPRCCPCVAPCQPGPPAGTKPVLSDVLCPSSVAPASPVQLACSGLCMADGAPALPLPWHCSTQRRPQCSHASTMSPMSEVRNMGLGHAPGGCPHGSPCCGCAPLRQPGSPWPAGGPAAFAGEPCW